MHSPGTISKTKQEFWTVFGKYMTPVPSAEGLKINWINYKTGVKDVYFKMDAQNDAATISISIEHTDDGIRQLYFEQFLEFKTMLHSTLEEQWEWQSDVTVGGKKISRVIKELSNASVLNKDQWPELISFFKPRIIALDNFWGNARYTFESLN